MQATTLVERVLSGESPRRVVESAPQRDRVITSSTIAKWKKDLRKLNKIYKDIKPETEDEKTTLRKFQEARKIYSKFRKGFEEWAFVGVLGAPSSGGIRAGSDYWQQETREMEQVRTTVSQAMTELNGAIFPTGYDYKTSQHNVPKPHELTDKKKAANIRRYQAKFSKVWPALEALVKKSGGQLFSRMPVERTMDIAGYHLTLAAPTDPKDHAYVEKDIQEKVSALKKALPIVKKKLTKVLPSLARVKIPLIYDAEVNLDSAATYNAADKSVNLKSCGILPREVDKTCKVLVHEFCHHYYKYMMSSDAIRFWEKAVRSNYGDFDVDLIKKLWNKDESLTSFMYRVKDNHPDIFLQLAAYAEGMIGHGGTRLNRVDDFLKKHADGDVPSVMKNPITAYAHKNEEEAFCEAMSMYVVYGPRAVYPIVRKWLRVVAPEANINESAEDSIDRILQGEDPKDVITEITTAAHSLGTKIPKPMGMVKKTRKKNQGSSIEESKAKANKLATSLRKTLYLNSMKKRSLSDWQNAIERAWEIGDEGDLPYVLREVNLGVAYGQQTGRLTGEAERALKSMTLKQYTDLLGELAVKGHKQSDVPRYLNSKYTSQS